MSTPKILPLSWEPHHVKNNGFYGVTVTGAIVVYVYQPVDMRMRGKYKWAVFQYWGSNPDRDGEFGEIINPRTGKPARYTLPGQAKRAAQEYWKRQMKALIVP